MFHDINNSSGPRVINGSARQISNADILAWSDTIDQRLDEFEVEAVLAMSNAWKKAMDEEIAYVNERVRSENNG